MPRPTPGRKVRATPSATPNPPRPATGDTVAGDPVAKLFEQLNRMQQSITRLAARLGQFEDASQPTEAESGEPAALRVVRTCSCGESFPTDPGNSEMCCGECREPARGANGDPIPF